MKKVYTLVYSLNNIDNKQNYVINLQNIEKDENIASEVLESIELSPSKEIVNSILRIAKEV